MWDDADLILWDGGPREGKNTAAQERNVVASGRKNGWTGNGGCNLVDP